MRRRGLTLVEMVVVLSVLVIVAAIVVPLLTATTDNSKLQVTTANLAQLRDIIMGRYRNDMSNKVALATDFSVHSRKLPRPGAYDISHDSRHDAPQLRYLFVQPLDVNPSNSGIPQFDPFTKFGWHGPYLMSGRGTYALDADALSVKGWATSGFTEAFGKTGDPAVLDGWGNPIVLIESAAGAELRSAGAPKMSSGSPHFSLDVNVYDTTQTNNVWLRLATY